MSIPQGWQCPKCLAIHAPFVWMCSGCLPQRTNASMPYGAGGAGKVLGEIVPVETKASEPSGVVEDFPMWRELGVVRPRTWSDNKDEAHEWTVPLPKGLPLMPYERGKTAAPAAPENPYIMGVDD